MFLILLYINLLMFLFQVGFGFNEKKQQTPATKKTTEIHFDARVKKAVLPDFEAKVKTAPLP